MPFTSKRQWRAAFAGKIPGLGGEKAHEWAHKTKEFKDLPDRAPGEKGEPTLRSKKSQLAHGHDSGKGLSEIAISKGVKVEMEHTKNPATARQIAIDHLRERPDYYKLLEKVEGAPKTSNYKLQDRRTFGGLDISVENKKGSTRKWFDPHGKESGSTFMHYDYGYIRKTKGTDGDHVDVYVGPDEDADQVYVVNQMKKPDFKAFDEQKVMLGFKDAAQAKAAYLKQYNDPRFFGSMKSMPFEEFKSKVLLRENHGKKVAGTLAGIIEGAEARIAKTQGGDLGKAFGRGRWAKGHPKSVDANAGRIRDLIGLGSKVSASAGWADAAIHRAGEALEQAGKGTSYALALKRHGAQALEAKAKSLGKPVAELASEAAKRTVEAGMHRTSHPTVRKALRESIAELRKLKTSAEESNVSSIKIAEAKVALTISPGMISGLQHAGVGAGLGALAGGIGGAIHAGPEHRRQGIMRGALVGAGLGAAGGAGISAIKQHGANQLASLRGQAAQAESRAVEAHQALQHMPSVKAPTGGGASREALGTASTQLSQVRAPAPAQEAGTLAGKAGLGKPMGQAPSGPPSMSQPILDTQQRHVMNPSAWGASAEPVAHSTPAARQVAESIASARGGGAEALRQAADTLEQQHGVMNTAINRAGLVGAAAGTGLMGYMAVPKEYGGISREQPMKVGTDINELAAQVQQMKAEKERDTRSDRIIHGLDTLGLGILAAPAAGGLVAEAGEALKHRGGRLGALGSVLHSGGSAVEKALGEGRGKHIGEVVGLGMMVPHLIHPLAHRITAPSVAPTEAKVAAASVVQLFEALTQDARQDPRGGSPRESPLEGVADLKTFSLAAQKVGRLMAHEAHAPSEKVAISLGGAVAGLGKAMWKYKKPLAGLAAVGTVGAGLYGAKKGIDATANLANESHAHEPARYVGPPPGMRPAAPAPPLY